MISQLFIYMVKYAFGFPVVAIVSHIPVKSRMAVSRMAVNYVTHISNIYPGIFCKMSASKLSSMAFDVVLTQSNTKESDDIVSGRTYRYTCH